MEPAALEYERKERRPPYLDAAPGRVTLVMPPPPYWLAVAVVTTVVLLWLALTASALCVAIVWWFHYAGAVPDWAAPLLATGAAVMAFLAHVSFAWLRGDALVPLRIDVADGMLTYNWPGPWARLRTHRRPLARVRQVRAREHQLGPLRTVDLRVGLRPLGTIRRVFRSPHAGFAAEVEAAFAQAIAAGRLEEPPCSTG